YLLCSRLKRTAFCPAFAELGRASAAAGRVRVSHANRESVCPDSGHNQNRELFLRGTLGRTAPKNPLRAAESGGGFLRRIDLSARAGSVGGHDSAERRLGNANEKHLCSFIAGRDNGQPARTRHRIVRQTCR